MSRVTANRVAHKAFLIFFLFSGRVLKCGNGTDRTAKRTIPSDTFQVVRLIGSGLSCEAPTAKATQVNSSRGRGTSFAKVFEDGLGLGPGNYSGQGGHIRLLHGLQAAEMFEQAAGGGFSYAGDFSELGCPVSNLAALAMEGYGKAMGFVANHLDQV